VSKGKSHEKVVEIRPWDVSLVPNKESLLVLKFFGAVFDSYDFLVYTLLNKSGSHLNSLDTGTKLESGVEGALGTVYRKLIDGFLVPVSSTPILRGLIGILCSYGCPHRTV
jgi:hypothetical protein